MEILTYGKNLAFNPYEKLAYYKQKCKYYLSRMEHAQLPKEIMMKYNPAEEISGVPYRSGRLQTSIAN
jgi:hypothetical protein